MGGHLGLEPDLSAELPPGRKDVLHLGRVLSPEVNQAVGRRLLQRRARLLQRRLEARQRRHELLQQQPPHRLVDLRHWPRDLYTQRSGRQCGRRLDRLAALTAYQRSGNSYACTASDAGGLHRLIWNPTVTWRCRGVLKRSSSTSTHGCICSRAVQRGRARRRCVGMGAAPASARR